MNSILTCVIIFACVFGGALLGLALRTVLPGHHLNVDAKEAVKLGMEEIQVELRNLTPKSDLQRSLQTQAIQISDGFLELRWLLLEQLQTSPPPMFLGMLLFWWIILFACFGLLAPRNGTVIVVFLVCALSVAGEIFLILEMERPLRGMMKVSGAPMIKTLGRLGK